MGGLFRDLHCSEEYTRMHRDYIGVHIYIYM